MNRKLLFAIILVVLFAIGIIAWFFFFAQPTPTPSLNGPYDPFSIKNIPRQFQFVFKKTSDPAPISISTTEMTFPKPEALTEVWSRPATGQTFVDQLVIKEVDATSTQGTTTIATKKLIQATTTALLFVDRITGYVYSYNRGEGKIFQISNTTIPGVYDAYIFNNGKRILLRYADNEKNTIIGLVANIPSVGEKDQAKPLENTMYLPAQVTSVAVNKKRTLVSYLVTGDGGASIYTLGQKGAALVATTPFKEWNLLYGGDMLYATSKPSAYVSGQTVSIPTFEIILGDKTGLMSNPSESGILLNSMWSDQGLKTFLSFGSKQAVLNIETLASKCTWGQKDFLVCAVPKIVLKAEEGLPDDWFQGSVSFDDILVTVNPTTSQISSLFTFNADKYGVFDVTNFSLSRDNTFISFNKKQGGSLWLLDTSLIGAE